MTTPVITPAKILYKHEKYYAALLEYDFTDMKDLIDDAIAYSRLHLEEDPEIRSLFGKRCFAHRNIGFFSDATKKGYGYPGNAKPAVNFNPSMAMLVEQVNKKLGTNFNSILVNIYKSGEDYIGKHKDNESSVIDGVVLGISVGQVRKFRIRDGKNVIVCDAQTYPYKGLMMAGEHFQTFLTHEVPVEKRAKEERVSLTLRRVHI